MQITRYFQDLDPDEVHLRVAESWDFVLGWIPSPRFEVRCPQCGAQDLQLSRVNVGKRKNSPIPFRIDISFKCTRCSGFQTFGIPVREEIAKRAGGSRHWHWREIHSLIIGGK